MISPQCGQYSQFMEYTGTDVQLVFDGGEQMVSIIRAVVRSHTRVVPAVHVMGQAQVGSQSGMKYRLFGTRIPHVPEGQ